MDAVQLSDSSRVLDGLRDMLAAALGDEHDYVHSHVEVPVALLIIEAAKRADDRPEWFIRGKWATIQAIQAATDKQLSTLYASCARTRDE